MSADYPMQAVQVDGSSSEHLVPERRIRSENGEEDWLLAFETLAREARRRVDIAGIVRWDGREYELEAAAAPRFIGRQVLVRRGLAKEADRDVLLIEDLATGERALAHSYRPRAYGEVRPAPPPTSSATT